MESQAMITRFEDAYDKYSDAIFRHCFFRLSDKDRALEIMQETFTRTWEYLAKGKEIDTLRPFLYRVASNLIIEEYRKHKTVSLDAFLEGEDHTEGMLPGLRDDETAERILDILDGKQALEALKQLPDTYREVIVFRFVDGLTPKEIALFLGERENTVSVRIHRGLSHLKQILQPVP